MIYDNHPECAAKRFKLFTALVNNKILRLNVLKYIKLINRQLFPFTLKYTWADLEGISSIQLLGNLRLYPLIYKQLELSEQLYNQYNWDKLIATGGPLANRSESLGTPSTPSTASRKRTASTKYADFDVSTKSRRSSAVSSPHQGATPAKKHQFMSFKNLEALVNIVAKNENLDLLTFIWDRYAFGKDHYRQDFVNRFIVQIGLNDSHSVLECAMRLRIVGVYELEENLDFFLESGAVKVIKFIQKNHSFLMKRKPLYSLAKSGDTEFFKTVKLKGPARMKAIQIAAEKGKLELLQYLFDETGIDEEMAIDSVVYALGKLACSGDSETFKYICKRYNLDLRLYSRKLVSLGSALPVGKLRINRYIWKCIAKFNKRDGLPDANLNAVAPFNVIPTKEQEEAIQLNETISSTTDLDYFIYLYKLYGDQLKGSLDLYKCDYPVEILRYIYEHTDIPKLRRSMPHRMVKRGIDVIDYLYSVSPLFDIYGLYKPAISNNCLALLKHLRSQNKDKKSRNGYNFIAYSSSIEMAKYLNETMEKVYLDVLRNNAQRRDLDLLIYLSTSRNGGFHSNLRSYGPDTRYFMKYIYWNKEDDEDNEDSEDDEDEDEDDYKSDER